MPTPITQYLTNLYAVVQAIADTRPTRMSRPFNFSWIGEVARKLRNAITPEANAQQKAIEEQSEAAWQYRQSTLQFDHEDTFEGDFLPENLDDLRSETDDNMNHSENREQTPHESVTTIKESSPDGFDSGNNLGSSSFNNNEANQTVNIHEFNPEDADFLDEDVLNEFANDVGSDELDFEGNEKDTDYDEAMDVDELDFGIFSTGFAYLENFNRENETEHAVANDAAEPEPEQLTEASNNEDLTIEPKAENIAENDVNTAETSESHPVAKDTTEPEASTSKSIYEQNTHIFDGGMLPAVGFDFGPALNDTEIATDQAALIPESLRPEPAQQAQQLTPPAPQSPPAVIKDEQPVNESSNTEQEPRGVRENEFAGLWNLFNVGFTVTPDAPQESVSLESNSQVNNEREAANEHTNLASTAKQLLSTSGLFGGNPQLKRKWRNTDLNEGNNQSSSKISEDSKQEIRKVSGHAQSILSHSALFGGKPVQHLEPQPEPNTGTDSNGSTTSETPKPQAEPELDPEPVQTQPEVQIQPGTETDLSTAANVDPLNSSTDLSSNSETKPTKPGPKKSKTTKAALKKDSKKVEKPKPKESPKPKRAKPKRAKRAKFK